MAQIVLFDSDFVIDLLNGNPELLPLVRQEADIYISAITRMEVQAGARNKIHLSRINKALQAFPIIPVDTEVSDLAQKIFEEYVLSHGLRINDCLIAATAIQYDMSLYTFNQKDFRFIAGLHLIQHGIKPMQRKKGLDG